MHGTERTLIARTQRRLLGCLGLGGAGLIATVAGLIWDARLHARDPGLAEREGVFTLGNAAHVTFTAGLSLAGIGVAGALLVVLTERGGAFMRRPKVRLALSAAAALVVLAVGGAGAWAAAAGDSHSHPAAPAAHQHPAVTGSGATGSATHDDKQPGDVTSANPAERAAARKLLADTIAATSPYRDPAAAGSAGFVFDPAKTTGVIHVPNPAYRRDGRLLDPAHPESLLYVRNPVDGSLVLVGVLFQAPIGERGPTPGGPIMVWHTHTNCFDVDSHEKVGKPENGVCPPRQELRTSNEMMHMWFTGDLATAFSGSAPPLDALKAYQRKLHANA